MLWQIEQGAVCTVKIYIYRLHECADLTVVESPYWTTNFISLSCEFEQNLTLYSLHLYGKFILVFFFKPLFK